jgi:Flp pilus assembly protein TadG
MKRGERQAGSAIVEAALVLPLLFALLFSVFEFGRAYNIYHALTNAAREGVRYGIAPNPGTSTLPTVANIETRVCNYLAGVRLACNPATNVSAPPCSSANVTQVDVCVDPAVNITVNGAALVYTQVNVRAPYRFLYFPFGTITLGTRAVMRNETN